MENIMKITTCSCMVGQKVTCWQKNESIKTVNKPAF